VRRPRGVQEAPPGRPAGHRPQPGRAAGRLRDRGARRVRRPGRCREDPGPDGRVAPRAALADPRGGAEPAVPDEVAPLPGGSPMTARSFPASRPLPPRAFLRGAGVALSLPLLDAMVPAFAPAQESAVPRRMLAIQTTMGILPQFFFPEGTGKDYRPSPYLE